MRMSEDKVAYKDGKLTTERKIGKDNVGVSVDVKTGRVSVAFGLDGKPIDYSKARPDLSQRGAVDYIKRVTGEE